MSNMFVAASAVFAGYLVYPHSPTLKRCLSHIRLSISGFLRCSSFEDAMLDASIGERLGPSHGEFLWQGVSLVKLSLFNKGLEPI